MKRCLLTLEQGVQKPWIALACTPFPFPPPRPPGQGLSDALPFLLAAKLGGGATPLAAAGTPGAPLSASAADQPATSQA